MVDGLPGIHHVTAIAGDPRENLEFYTDVLGLRFVKKTVNFDDPGTYHLYYGDRVATPGTAMTFFPFEGAGSGTVGRGQVSETAFAVPEGSLEAWRDRLDEHGVDRDDVAERFGDRLLPLRDGDGQPLALVETGDVPEVDPWDEIVPAEQAIRGFHGVTLHSTSPDETAEVLDTLGLDRVDEDGDRTRYHAPGDRARVVDLLDAGDAAPAGRQGAGTVHHVAFQVEDAESQREWRERLLEAGYDVTEVRDRRYFESIYFREPGGVLIEIATNGPGFDRDESVADLGSELRLPPWLEERRDAIETQLPALEIPAEAQR